MTSPFASVPAPALVLTSIVSVQVGAGVAKGLFEQLPPSAVVFLRLATASVVLVLVTNAWRSRTLRTVTSSDVLVVAGFGVSLAIMNLAFYESLSRIPLGVAVTVEFLGPLGVSVAYSRRRADLVWVGLAGIGVVLLARGSVDDLDPLGLAFALVAGAMWAGYIVLSAQTGRRFGGSSGLALATVVGTVIMAPIGLASGGAEMWHLGPLATAAAIGLLSSAIPYALELEALRRMPARVFGIFMSLEPAVAAMVGLVVLHEVLHAREWAAIACVIAACVGASRASPRRPGEGPAWS